MSLMEWDLCPRGAQPAHRLLWATDLHLNLAEADVRAHLLESFSETQADGIVLTGDLTDGPAFETALEEIKNATSCPIYFVIGNHECYDIGIEGAREKAAKLAEREERIHYLSTVESPVVLSDQTAMIGFDGWADGRCGNFLETPVQINDFQRVPELADLSPQQRLRTVERLGTHAAQVLGERLEEALQGWEHVLVLTHVPPFREASRYRDCEANDEWGPHFVCQALGEKLREITCAYPDRQATVLCGHAHHPADIQVGANLRVLTGDAKSGVPQLQGWVQVS